MGTERRPRQILSAVGRRLSRAERDHVLQDPGETVTVDLEGLQLEVMAAGMHDASWYVQRPAFEEKGSRLYPLIAAAGYENFVDVGANVGLISILARRANPALRGIAIEPDPRVATLLLRNLERHGFDDTEVVTALAGESDSDAESFRLNPASSLDNRVLGEPGEDWPAVDVPAVSLAGLLDELGVSGPTFFKIDTQGFERQVLAGAEPWLRGTPGWTIKMEFAPHWLRSQGTDPAALLSELTGLYEVAEAPARLGFETPSIASLFASPLRRDDAEAFVGHVTALDKRGRGWVDLLLRPGGPA